MAGILRPQVNYGLVTHRYITRHTELTAFCEELRTALQADPRLAIDTEFVRERTYLPQLEMIQVATSSGLIGLLDMQGLHGDAGPLAEILLDPGVLKMIHAGGQDAEILASLLGRLPTPIFDTQIAAAFAGFALQTGYGVLVSALLNVRLTKGEAFPDWSRRPISPSMLAYAADDVRYVHAMHDALTKKLGALGRERWAAAATERALQGAADVDPPEDLWQRVGGRNSLDGRGLAILRELAIWRDNEAKRRDKPRRTVFKDEALVEIAKRRPSAARAVLEMRGMPGGVSERTAAELVDCVQAGMAVPPDQRPLPEGGISLDEHGAALYELLSAVAKVRAFELDIAGGLLVPSDALRALAAGRDVHASNLIFDSWRDELIGDDLRAALNGSLSVAWDPKRQQLVLHHE